MLATLRALATDQAEQAAELAGAANVRFLSRVGGRGPAIPEAASLEPVLEGALVTVVENRHALPFAQLYPELAWVSGPNAKRLPFVAQLARAGVASHTLEPAGEAAPPEPRPDYVMGAEARRLAPSLPLPPEAVKRRRRNVAAPCDVERPGHEAIRLRCRFSSPGYLVVAESWSPRWTVQVDGAERPLLRLNHAFQGVAVAPGDRAVRFAYVASPLTRASLAISVLAWTGLLGALLVSGARRLRPRSG